MQAHPHLDVWHKQRTVHGHTTTFKDMQLNYPRNAHKGVHNFLGLEDQRFLHADSSHGMLPRCQFRETPLELVRAIQFGDMATVDAKLAAGESPHATNSGGETLLHIAVLHDQPRAVQLLLEHGVAVNARTHWRPILPFQNHIPHLYAFVTASEGATPLHYACGLSSLALVKTLLAAGAQIDLGANEMCGAPLLWALTYVRPNRSRPPSYGRSAPDRPVDIVRLLLVHGASPHCRDVEDNSAVAVAVRTWTEPMHATRLYQLVAALVEAGININHKNTLGWTAWDVAPTAAIKAMLAKTFNAASGRRDAIERCGNVERERDQGRPWLRPLYVRCQEEGSSIVQDNHCQEVRDEEAATSSTTD
ncbi:Aste57867_103 [Aphanomyces stellatus]|uniref:Aste57867_103 protein n=1 Tax=Aphanomyces stellatus TaxID=120398 RepID=A0A485K302_9STRA|nr:hypothetical protein As57867_000103 [Aphanomyces stellatus]VFT77329.1 Aste57867_103 [Aphanomyces stellatus]